VDESIAGSAVDPYRPGRGTSARLDPDDVSQGPASPWTAARASNCGRWTARRPAGPS